MRCFHVLLLCLMAAAAHAQTDSKPFVLGRIETIQSKILGEARTLNIYLPPGYGKNDTSHYPVVYLLDGSADEDFIHTVGLFQYAAFDWVGWVKPSIIVGIANTNRKRDFTFPSTRPSDQKLIPGSGGSVRFIQFLEKELLPFVQQHFRSSGSTLIGESLGALLATEVLFEKPTLFDRYILISPSLWWDDGSLLRRPLPPTPDGLEAPIEVYVGVGKEGLTPGEPPHVQEVDANLLAEKLKRANPAFLRVWFDYLPSETHATIGYQAALNALRFFAGKNCPH